MAENKRYRVFNLLLYPDNVEHQKAIENLKSVEYKAVGILHNMDCYTEDKNEHKAGELKKEHYHFVVKFQNAKTIIALAKNLNIESRFIEPTQTFKGSAKYLLHIGCEDKYQYDIDDLIGTLAPDVVKLIDDTSEEVKALNICRLLRDCEYFVTRDEFMQIVCKNGLYTVFRRNAYYFSSMLYEHNENYSRG